MSDEQEQAAPLKILSIDDILAADDLEEQTIYVSEWGGSLRIRALNRGEVKDAYRRARVKGELDNDLVERYLMCWSSIEPKITPAAFDQLAKKNAGAVAKVIGAILGLSGVDEEALANARQYFRAGS